MFEHDNIFFKTRNLSDLHEEYPETNDRITKIWPKEPPQRYTGEVFNGNVHRHGFYFVENGEKLFYDGLFYANKLEGYSQVFYNDGSDFQGLFKNNSRFGPGVFSYPNGEQDVGLWNGKFLTRLSGFNERNYVPKLASTLKGQIKLLKYRYLVPVCPEQKNLAYSILESLGASKKVLRKSHKLYNLQVENKGNLFFNKSLFDKHYYTYLDCCIDIGIDEDEDNNDNPKQEEDLDHSLNLNTQRIENIKVELEEIEARLNAVKNKRTIIENKVAVCRTCCLVAMDDVSTMSQEEISTQTPSAIKLISVKSGRSRIIIPTHLSKQKLPTIDDNSPERQMFVFPTELVRSKSTAASRGDLGRDLRRGIVESLTRIDENKFPVIPLNTIITKYPALMQDNEPLSCPVCTHPEKYKSASQETDVSIGIQYWKSFTVVEATAWEGELSGNVRHPWIPSISVLVPIISFVLFQLFILSTEVSASDRSSINDNVSPSDTDFLEDAQVETDEKFTDIEIQEYLQENCICDEEMQSGDITVLEKELESLIKDELFYESISINLRKKLKMHTDKCQESNKTRTKKKLIKEILAWNNEEQCMKILKHSFLHRKSEYMVNFNVSDVVSGNRFNFSSPGLHERNCLDFLNACSTGNTTAIFEHINRNYVDVNVCDNKGNSGIMFAAINRQIETISVLTNLGAKLDQQNDEGLLPLSICLLILIEEKYTVEDWEKAFLQESDVWSEQSDAIKWYPNASLLTVLERNEKSKESVKSKLKKFASSPIVFKEDKCYMFDTSYVNPLPEDIPNQEDKTFVFKRTRSVTMSQEQTTLGTIRMLLDCGANPNAGDAPLPPLIISLFTENPSLVECILTAKADVDVTIEDDMTPLHIASSLKCSQANVEICSLLLAFAADPRLKTSTNHWAEQKESILGKTENTNDIKDEGKNALHILCMRKDFVLDRCSFFQKMAMVLTDSNIDVNEKYLGHTPLSLAVLVGNQVLAETLIKFYHIDPYQLLDYGMGNVLTLYILKRYQDLLPPNAKDTLKVLVELGVNPLKSIGEFENCIEFIENEHGSVEETKSGKKKTADSLKKTQNSAQEELIVYMKELCRDTIIRAIQLQAVENLYNLIEEHMTEHECVPILADFLSPFVVISNLQNIFTYGKIKSERYDRNLCLQLIDLVVARQEEVARNVAVKKVKKLKPEMEKNVPVNVPDYGHVLDMTDFSRKEKCKWTYRLLPPGLDGRSKYKVCFHCLKKADKKLLACPQCQLIYFCSDACNKANLKLKTMHPCNTNFYAIRLSSMASGTEVQKQDFSQLYDRIRENCSKRRILTLEEKANRIKAQLALEMKADIYGTRMIKKLKGYNKIIRTPTMTTLVGSVSELPVPSLGTKCTNESANTEKLSRYSTSNRKGSVLSNKSQKSDKKPIRKSLSEQKYMCMVNKKHESSLKELTAVRDLKTSDQQICRKHICDCFSEECVEEAQEKREDKLKYKCFQLQKDKAIGEKVIEKHIPATDVVVKKLRKIPERYQQFMELLVNYFPDIDFSSLFLPYACFSDGQMYYKFLDSNLYTRTYSMM